jgi:hypothetical protein
MSPTHFVNFGLGFGYCERSEDSRLSALDHNTVLTRRLLTYSLHKCRPVLIPTLSGSVPYPGTVALINRGLGVFMLYLTWPYRNY